MKITRETTAGFKLLAHSKGAIQEVFVVVEGSRDKVRESLKSLGVSVP